MSSRTDKRAMEIVNLLLRRGKISVEGLAAELASSPASIRRDLTRLEEKGLVHRTHGGARLSDDSHLYTPFRFDAIFREREDRFANEKLHIGRAAAALVQDGETIGISAGTTTTQVARQLAHRKNLHVITNGVNIGMELSSKARIETTLTGGTLRWAGAFSMVGARAIETLQQVFMERVFLSATGVDAERGVSVIQPEEAAVFRAMARQARQRVIVADSSKLGCVSPSIVCIPAEIDLLITDHGASDALLRAFEKSNVKVLLV